MTDGYTLITNETKTLREWIADNGRQSISWVFFLTKDWHDCYYKANRFTKRELDGNVVTVCERCGKYELTVEL